ncbi:MAG: DNA topoisomerase I [Candidatus Woesearchaeota archaeon]
MGYELIITEKPNAAKKLAEALADGKPVKENYKGVPFYKVTHGNKDIVVGCAVGHLFGLAEKEKKGFQYPVFDIEWVPVYEIQKSAEFSKKYADALKRLVKGADSFTVACDYDVEGEVIGLNVIRYICNRNDARRMKFSTLTKDELVESYEKAASHLDWGQAEAGETRHYLDYYYGINISRALTSAIKSAGMFKIMSTGRVQGPALKIIVDREKEIRAFKPVPYWEIELNAEARHGPIIAWHKTGKFWKKQEAEVVMKKVHGAKEGIVAKVERRQFSQNPPHPFDLTTLQTEAYKCLGISPKATLAIAQDLYTEGYISYPRTSSQQLPPAIGYKKILDQLARQSRYAPLCQKVLSLPKLSPYNGSKTDPAHPAIYPTGVTPGHLEDREFKIYDLIVKRFLSTFGEPAIRETMNIIIEVNNEPFGAEGTRTVEKNWHVLYEPYVRLEEVELPNVNENERVKVKNIQLHDRETQPPKRYTPSSIIRELEKRNLGTKATRAEIIDTLFKRNYVTGEPITATDFGIRVIEVLEKYAPKIIDEELTRHFELEMDSIRERKKKKEQVLSEAKVVLIEILGDFKKKEKQVGNELKTTFTETRAAMTTIGFCPVCKKGEIVLRKGRFGRFAACNKYPECKTTFKLPLSGLVEVGKEVCPHCSYPMITMIRKAKRPQQVCINPDCPSKKIHFEQGRKCPKCQEGELVLRKSVYGQFIACNKFPKCRYIERMKKEEKGEAEKPKAVAKRKKKTAKAKKKKQSK